jgi:hypothetical protein
MPYRWWRERENSGIALRLLWRVHKEEIGDEIDTGTWYAGVGGTPAWLTKPKLAELGFDVSQPENSDRGRKHYEKQLPREVRLVLELDGRAYAEALERAKRYADREDALRAANPDKKEFERRYKRLESTSTAVCSVSTPVSTCWRFALQVPRSRPLRHCARAGTSNGHRLRALIEALGLR